MQGENSRDLIKFGWHSCVLSFWDVLHPERRAQAIEEALAKQQRLDSVPDSAEHEVEAADQDRWDEEDSDDEKDELDIMKERAQPSRKLPPRDSKKRGRVQRFGGGVDPTRIEVDD